MRAAFVSSLFLALALPCLGLSLPARDNCPAPKTCPPEKTCPTPTSPCPTTTQFCSKCPRTENRGNPLLAVDLGAAYLQCIYKDTNCFYGPLSDSANILSSSFPAGACPTTLGDNVCSDPLPPVGHSTITTRCPDTNLAYIHTPLRSQPDSGSPAVIQCHYAASECFYDNTPAGLLITSSSIPAIDSATGLPGCRPALVESHLQQVI